MRFLHRRFLGTRGNYVTDSLLQGEAPYSSALSAGTSPIRAFPEFTYRPDITVQIREFARRRQTPVTLRDMFEYGSPPVTSDKLLAFAQFIHREIPIRLARRVQSLENLPYGLSRAPSVRRVRDWYLESFVSVRSVTVPKSDEDQRKFTELLKQMMIRHKHVVPTMAQGVYEVKRSLGRHSSHLVDECLFLQDFLERFYLGRLGIRVILAQHIALQNPKDNYVGIIQKGCSPFEIISHAAEDARQVAFKHLGAAPQVKIIGDPKLTFRYIPEHFHHIMFELLKNSLRAQVEHAGLLSDHFDPIVVIVADGDQDITVKVSDRGGGIPRKILNSVWNYSFSTAADPSESSESSVPSVNGWLGPLINAPMAGFGYGLPLSRLYARCFGGDLVLVPMYGYGTDAYLYLSKLGDSDGVVLGDS